MLHKMFGGNLILSLINYYLFLIHFYYQMVLTYSCMFFPVDYNNTSNDKLLEKFDASIKNKGANISLQNRKLDMTQFLARVSDLEDLPKQMSNLFFGNSSRLQHLLFDDFPSSFDGTSSAKDFIINSIKSIVNSRARELLD